MLFPSFLCGFGGSFFSSKNFGIGKLCLEFGVVLKMAENLFVMLLKGKRRLQLQRQGGGGVRGGGGGVGG